MRTTLLCIGFLCFYISLSAQVNLQVNNPVNTWNTHRGTIEEASVVIDPIGIYYDVSLYLTFSAEGTPFASGDSLEVALDFNLPEEAAIFDSWLWIEDIIVKADILDRRTATDIYEEIVNRRQDPSILFKLGAGRYQLRVYPMLGSGSRKVMIRYLLPASWSPDSVIAALPMEILLASENEVPELEILVWDRPDWGMPWIPELPDVEFQYGQNTELGYFHYTTLGQSQLSAVRSLAFNAPMQNGIYLSKNDSLGIYNMVALPEELVAFPPSPGRKLYVLLDHKPGNTYGMDKEALLMGLESELVSNLEAEDQFKIWATTNNIPAPLTDGWTAGDATSIHQAFSNLELSSFQSGGQLNRGIEEILEEIATDGEEAAALVISNSQEEGDPWFGEQLVEIIQNANGFELSQLYFINYQNRHIAQWWDIWSQPDWFGNDFYYTELARLSGGEYRKSGQYRYKIRKALEASDLLRGSVELYTTLSNGLCYNRFLLGGNPVDVPLHRPLYQVGRYQGDFPFELEYSAILESTLLNNSAQIDENIAVSMDTLADESWAANYLLSLESASQSDAIAEVIVEKSIDHRVLSLHTAFLCLEPNQGGEPCTECIDIPDQDIVIVQTDEQTLANVELSLVAYPNPFREQVRIIMELPPGAARGEYQFAIYDEQGRLIRTFNHRILTAQREVTIEWDGNAVNGYKLPTGLYTLIVKGPNGQGQLKLIKAG